MSRVCRAIVVVLFANWAFAGQPAGAEEKEDGFLSLFNGKDLGGWVYLGKGKSPFSVKDGAIYYKGGSGWLCYEKQEFPHFELRLEFRLIKKGGDGGIFFRASKDAKGGASWPSQRYELQVKDYAQQARLWGLPYQLDEKKVANVRKPVGEWETYRLIVQGPRVRVYLNGELVTTSDGAKRLSPGFIGLQAERGEQAFRNLRIRPLPAE
ncbi:MAG: hypothetical protein KatS3mg105_1871 [Gemmatales bacterium]|nr:MAG: hypothetical protein KatS3mg105_1871 [Gemmatales bacterium]